MTSFESIDDLSTLTCVYGPYNKLLSSNDYRMQSIWYDGGNIKGAEIPMDVYMASVPDEGCKNTQTLEYNQGDPTFVEMNRALVCSSDAQFDLDFDEQEIREALAKRLGKRVDRLTYREFESNKD